MTGHLPELIRKTSDQTLKLAYQYPLEDPAKPDALKWVRWDWQIGVGFYGLWKAYELLGDDYLVNQMKAWIDARIHDRIDSININTTGPMLTVFHLAEKFHEDRYNQLFRFFDWYLFYFGLRTPCGALSHTVIGKHRPHQIWADTLFMAILYMQKKAAATANDFYRQETVHQIMLLLDHLVEKESGLFYHGWHDVEKRFMGVKWGRGNCWITAGLVEILELMPPEFPEREKIRSALTNQVAALAKLQHSDGLWHTVLDRDETYLETSVAAGVAYGVLKGIRLGYIDANYEAMGIKAVKAVISKIDAMGNVTGVSGGTPIFATVAEYNNVPYTVTPFGQGLALMALCEAAHSRE